MKKTFISLILVLALCLTLATTLSDQNQPTFAYNENNQYVMTIGCGEVFTKADTIELNFGLTQVSNSLSDGNKSLNEAIDQIKNAVLSVDPEAKVNVGYISSYPIAHAGIGQYQFNCNFFVTSLNPDKKDEIIEQVTQNGATSFQGSRLELSEKQDVYNQALTSAKEDAEQKAKALYGDVKLKEMYEVSIYSFEQNGEIKIEACVKAKFIINETENNVADQTTPDESVETNQPQSTPDNISDVLPQVPTPRQENDSYSPNNIAQA